MYMEQFAALSEAAAHLQNQPISVVSEEDALITIRDALATLETKFFIHARDEVTKHCDYLAEKSGLQTSELFEAETLNVHPNVFSDALNNISAVLASVSSPAENTAANREDGVEFIIKTSRAELEGWCSHEKARTMAQYIRKLGPNICVEIGVYGGMSLFPCAAALKENGQGRIYGIESWSNAVATENKTSDGNDEWWRAVDFEKIKRDVYTFAARHGLTSQVCLIEASSTKVSHLFDTIDFLHIDGSHSMLNAAADVIQYGMKVRSGGIIVMDDIEWDTTIPAVMILKDFCDELEVMENPSNGKPSAAFFRKR
ncbi:class I SAM-dependent methyltransferase [Agrobacterium larrymoorei]|uniref:O-methyltransferase YrrM n=1 Tax=Agrobacterium larrymoorei TaxID=160699 RepID=A0ABU0UI70_9HYPH|nr:class I SAM-dependent methyltransferase [Agrobacterium larrymoorei]MDQ1184630.1 putative O-methyltransferase YrrM [Agrobacterium larrymoorei]